MDKMTRLGLLVISVVTIISLMPTSAAFGAKPLFLSHSTGKLLASSGVQKLTTAMGKLECTGLHLTQGSTTLLRALSLLITVQYTGCNTELFGEGEYSPVQYFIDANSLVRQENNLVITLGGGLCKIQMPAAKNQSLENAVSFHNNAPNKGLLLLEHITGITSFGEGACAYAEENLGTLEGTIHLTLDGGGTLKWDLNA